MTNTRTPARYPRGVCLIQAWLYKCVWHYSLVSARKAKPSKDEINFDSDDDLPGLNDSIEKTPRDSPTPPPRSKPERRNTQKSQESPADIFGDDDDGLPGTGTYSFYCRSTWSDIVKSASKINITGHYTNIVPADQLSFYSTDCLTYIQTYLQTYLRCTCKPTDHRTTDWLAYMPTYMYGIVPYPPPVTKSSQHIQGTVGIILNLNFTWL